MAQECKRKIGRSCTLKEKAQFGFLFFSTLDHFFYHLKKEIQCVEGAAANRRKSGSDGHRFITWMQKVLFKAKSTLLLVIWVHNINSSVRCIG